MTLAWWSEDGQKFSNRPYDKGFFAVAIDYNASYSHLEFR